ncbi:Na+/H+ antiporter NhaA [Pseudodesulfovibrio piezophilus]|uniref:Na(+)/H(+) antiporter NhaA n=1 Tax=Pseudodesulfovibrio piezophilus (strain DSM 21447 / JCM 15486 / C1TLV30) TaxID=1322246 RepID=M1WWK5_PSEP2|nr:Na+/H+ antiporter NhaA [Pseudodesulfovibrio piezophilus]CCH49183.1 Na(+)/H(+) antiporter nhaA [Pseudodesulfovibrio piezophilus C1TLV30]
MSIKSVMTCGLEPIEQVLMPFQEFFQSKSTGGIILIISAMIALIWANSPWAASYVALWETKFTVGYGQFLLSKPLLLWVNDGLMAVFFFVVGLEIKREFMVGELSSRSQAVLPIVAAFGGMVIPAVIYSVINIGHESIHGWGVPMATDIAFALGILALLGDRVPYQLKIFLTAVAIVDDIGAVLVIALFYTSHISAWMLAAAAVLLAVAYVGNRMGIRAPGFYAALGCLVWLAVLKSGVHSTVAGVLMAFVIPARTRCDSEGFLFNANRILDQYKSSVRPGTSVLTNSTMHSALLSMQYMTVRAQTPLQRLEHALHPMVDYFIMPVFALANAGVILGGDFGQLMTSPVTVGTALGLVLGKPLGIVLSAWGIVKLSGGWPGGMSVRHFIGAGLLGGIGFTMSLFIAALAFEGNPALLNSAKTAILGASTLAGVMGYLVLRSLPVPAGMSK